MNFLNKPNHSNQDVFFALPKSHDKNLNILRTKREFKMKKKHFLSFLKAIQHNK